MSEPIGLEAIGEAATWMRSEHALSEFLLSDINRFDIAKLLCRLGVPVTDEVKAYMAEIEE